jgi:hypothetical protein
MIYADVELAKVLKGINNQQIQDFANHVASLPYDDNHRIIERLSSLIGAITERLMK